MSIEDAATIMNVDIVKYSNWENGVNFPTYIELKKISNIFHKPSIFFFFSKPPILPLIKGGLCIFPYINTIDKNILMKFEEIKSYQMNLYKLYGKEKNPLLSEKIFSNDINKLCSHLRNIVDFPLTLQKTIKNPKTIFEILREKFYKLGIIVFKDLFKNNDIFGLYINDNKYPIIIINDLLPFTYQNFVLFYGLYCLIANINNIEIKNNNCLYNNQKINVKHFNDCMSEFFIPSNDFKVEIKQQNIDRNGIEKMALLYSVNEVLIIHKLFRLNVITQSNYNILKDICFKDITYKNNLIQKNNDFLTKISYLGKRYVSNIFEQYCCGKIDDNTASEILDIKTNQLSELEYTLKYIYKA